MKTWFLGLMLAAIATALVLPHAQAKRVGGGKSSGMQRDMPARTAPDAPPAKPQAPAQASPQQAAPATPAAAPGKRSWLGPIAGLAAGLGLAALMSHLGLGEGFANILMLALLAVAAVFVVRLLLRRFAPKPAPAAMAYGSNAPSTPTQVAWPTAGAPPASPVAEPVAAQGNVSPAAAPVVSKVFVPAAFDSEGFERVAKMIFIRLQAANDAGDLDDLRSFTTPEMFASLRLDLQERGAATQHTDVVRVEAKVLDVAQEGDRQIVSVRFTGEVREEVGAAATAFDEIWHLAKPVNDGRDWAIAGIEQAQ